MKNLKLVYMDGYDEVRDQETQEVVFSTLLNKELAKHIGRHAMVESVVDNVVNIWNSGNIEDLDEYLLYEGDCTQDEREVIVESIYAYIHK